MSTLRVRKLSPSGDMTFGASQLNFLIDTPAAVGQIVQTALLLWYGEWYLDITLGMPWIEGVLGKHNQATADTTVQDYILQLTGVTNIENFQSQNNQANRLYTATMNLDTEFGETEVAIANQSLF
jgi:hypothetical protein